MIGVAERARGQAGGDYRSAGVPAQAMGLAWLRSFHIVVVLGVVAVAAARWHAPDRVPWALFVPMVVASGFLHTMRQFFATIAVCAVAMGWLAWMQPEQYRRDLLLTVVAFGVVVALLLWRNIKRRHVGVSSERAENMLVDLRNRLESHGQLPDLPAPWRAESCISSAFGQRFSGDFIVTHRSEDGGRVEMVLVDVSGKGVDVGARSLLLAGALSALLGTLPAHDFLPAANAYLLKQGWQEGFASAIHLMVDLNTGEFVARSAGHPPAAWFNARNQSWSVMEHPYGPLLGIVPDMHFPGQSGRLSRGDALLLYTDGLIEDRDHNIDAGIDRMLGRADAMVLHGGFHGGAETLCHQAVSGDTDDRAVIMVWVD